MTAFLQRAQIMISKVLVLGLLGSILTAILAPIEPASAAITVQQLSIPATVTSANDIAVSSDGTKLALISADYFKSPIGNGVYTSADSGATWTQTSSGLPQTSDSMPTWVGSSDSGANIVVTTYTSSILYLSSDYGASWTTKSLVSMRNSQCNGSQINFLHTQQGPESTGFAMSSDGSVIAIPVFNHNPGCMILSTDSGSTYSSVTLPTGYFGAQGAVYVSKSGNAIWLAKSDSVGGLWKYDLLTSTWSSNFSATVGSPRGLTGSQDGTIIYTAGSTAGLIFKSTDSGGTFSSLAGTSKNWLGIKSSADGTKLIGWDTGNNVWVSIDSGATWVFQNNPSTTINSVQFSADGTKAYMATGDYNSAGVVAKVFRYSFPVTSATTIASQKPSVGYGSSNTLTATITPTSATGTVAFQNNGTTITGCSAAVITSGVATCSSWLPSVGSYSNITAVYSGDGSYSSSTSSATSLTVTKAALSITASSPTVTYGDVIPTITASYSGLLNGDASTVVTGQTCSTVYTRTSAVGSFPATSCSGGTATNYTISYTAGSVTINKASPTLTLSLPAAATTAVYNTPVVVTATVSTPGSILFRAGGTAIPGCETVNAASTTGTCTWTPTSVSSAVILTADLTATDSTNYAKVSGIGSLSINVGKSAQAALIVSATTTSASYSGSAFTSVPSLSTSGGSDTGAVSYTVANGTATGCALSDSTAGATLTATAFGTCTITATKAATTNYNLTTASLTFTFNKATTTTSLAISSTAIGIGSIVYETATVSPSYTSGSVNFTSNGTSITGCSSVAISTGVAVCAWTPSTSGSYPTLAASYLGNALYYLTSASTSLSLQVNLLSQNTLSLTTTAATWSATQKTVTLSGTGGSGTGAYTYALDAANSAAGCSVTGSTLTYTTAGTCSVSVTRAASGNYAAVTTLVPVVIGKASQTITFSAIASQVFSTTPISTLPTSTSSLAPTLTSTTSSVCTVSGTSITMVSAGTCMVSLDQAGNANYLAAPSVVLTFTITSGSQSTLVLSAFATSANGLSATPSFSTTGGLGTGTVTYSVLAGGSATGCQLSSALSNALLSATSAGTCLVIATKAADSAYSAATSASLTFTFNGNPANAPINLAATPTSGQVALTWTHVDTSGASPISTFSVQYAANAGAWVSFTHSASTADSIIVTGLTNGTTYSFRVAAVTSAGTGTYSTTATAKPLGLAFIPTFGQSTPTVDGFTVSITNWNPAFVWGSAQVTSGTGSVTVGTGSGTTLPLTVTGMTPGANVTISITASQSSYSDGTAYASGTSLNAALIPDIASVATSTSGLTATISNFDSTFTWSASATSGNAAVSADGRVAVTGVNPLTSLTLTVTASRSLYATGSESTTATTLQLLRILYDGNNNTGGSAPTDATTYQSGATGTVLGNTGSLTKSGYTFIGWTLNSANTGQVYSAGNSYSLGLVGITLYAKWTAIPYTVTYQSTDATSGVAPLDQNAQGIQNIYNIGQNAPVLANSSLVRTGYSFGGWADNYPRTGTIYQSGGIYPITTNNVALYPVWTPNTYTVTYNVNSATGSPSKSSDSYTTASTAITLPTVGTMAKTGYAFTGWGRTAVSTPITGTLTVTTDTTLYAQWTLQSYSVTYLPGTPYGSGTVPTQADVAYGASFTLASPTGLTGSYGGNSYAFVAWSDGSGTTYASGKTLLMGAAPLTLTALWARIYNVTYSFNGGSVSSPIADQPKISGETITITSVIPTRTGYTFTNWLDQSSLSAVAGDSYTVTDTHYLIYAQWSAISYSVRYDTSGGSTAPAEPSHTIGEIFTTATLPTKNGYDFAGWSDGVTTYAAGSPYQIGAANISLIALWTPQVYDVSYDFNGGFGTAISPTHYTFATPAITLPTSGPTRPDFTFSGWSTSTTGAGVGATFTPSSSITLHAVWVSSVYRLIFDAGSGFTDTSTAKVTIGQSLTLPTGTRTNYNLAGWSTQQSGGTLVSGTYTPTADATMYAQWTLKVYVVTFNGNGGTASTGSASMTAGTTSPVTLTTAARSNYVFNGWYSDPQSGYLLGDAGSSYLPTNSITAYAHWIQASLAGMGAATQIAQVTVHAGYENSFTAGSNGSTVALYYPADSLPDGSIITAYLENSTTRASTLITTPANLILSLIVAWVAPDGTVPTTATGKPITLTVSNPNITAGSKVYGYLSGVMTYLGMAAVDGSAVVTISQDPVLVVAITTPDAPTGVTTVLNGSTGATISWSAPAASGGSAITSYVVTSSSGQSCTTTTTSCSITGLTAGSNYTFTVVATNSLGTSSVSTASSSLTITPPVVVVDNSAAIAAAAAQAAADAAAQAAAVKAAQEAAAKALADKQASDAAAKALADKQAADAAAKVLADKQAADAAAKALADKQAADAAAKILADQEAAALKAAQEKMAADAKALADAKAAADAAAVKAAQDAADASAKAAAELQAAKDAAAAQAAAAASIKPAVTLYSVTPKLTLSAYGTAYLQKYVRSLKNGATVTCVGYIYKKGTTLAKATALAKSQATAVCALIKKSNKTLKTTISLLDSSKAPKAAVGSKWVAVSYRIDSFKAKP